jgi:hypothetical protein
MYYRLHTSRRPACSLWRDEGAARPLRPCCYFSLERYTLSASLRQSRSLQKGRGKQPQLGSWVPEHLCPFSCSSFPSVAFAWSNHVADPQQIFEAEISGSIEPNENVAMLSVCVQSHPNHHGDAHIRCSLQVDDLQRSGYLWAPVRGGTRYTRTGPG